MYLKNWEPSVIEHRSHGYPTEYRLFFKIGLECPICHEVTERESKTCPLYSGIVPYITDTPLWQIERTIKDLRTAFKCSECGVLSGLPDGDLQRLKEEAVAKVTPEWVKEEIRKASRDAIKIA